MLMPSQGMRILVATKPVDFRKGAEGLAALVREEMRADPFGGAIFVFRAKRAVSGVPRPRRAAMPSGSLPWRAAWRSERSGTR